MNECAVVVAAGSNAYLIARLVERFESPLVGASSVAPPITLVTLVVRGEVALDWEDADHRWLCMVFQIDNVELLKSPPTGASDAVRTTVARSGLAPLELVERLARIVLTHFAKDPAR